MDSWFKGIDPVKLYHKLKEEEDARGERRIERDPYQGKSQGPTPQEAWRKSRIEDSFKGLGY